MIDKTSKEYRQGFKDGLNFAIKCWIENMKQFKKDIFDMMNMLNKQKGDK